MKIHALSTLCIMGMLLCIAACTPSSNNNVTPGNGSFQVSAPPSINVPVAGFYQGPTVQGDTTRIDAVMTITNPNATDTVHYIVVEKGNNLFYVELYDSITTPALFTQSPVEGFGVGNFTRRLQFKQQYPNRADTVETVKVAFWNAHHSDTVTILVHEKKAKGFVTFSNQNNNITGLACGRIYYNTDGFNYEYSTGTNFEAPAWDKSGNHHGAGSNGFDLGADFNPTLSTTPAIYTASSYANLLSGGGSKFYIGGSGGGAYPGSDFITTDTSAGQVKAWMGPQGPVIEVVQPIQLYARLTTFGNGAALGSITAMEFFY